MIYSGPFEPHCGTSPLAVAKGGAAAAKPAASAAKGGAAAAKGGESKLADAAPKPGPSTAGKVNKKVGRLVYRCTNS